ncbi:MAG: UDP-N-acetylmuramoyl-L-alanine--D-glutamate ligase [Parcubacteria group bacterium]|nr:UDP-N-acetylmuramoyl-L-alanine--D-glutamate ligase [Parcubacteria group bacterium]
MTPKEFLKGKKALVVVLGVYGGGAATAKWLLKNGAEVSVTDFRTEEELAHTMKLFTPREKKNIRFILGGQREEDFTSHDIIVLGPGVPKDSSYLAAAVRAGKQIENDASLFFRFIQNPVIAVTGTRGKTTVTAWLAYLLGQKYGAFIPTGNNPEHAFLKELSEITDKVRPVVAEMSSWQLEYLAVSGADKAPHIAIITNVFPDHLNRYKDIEEYARAKANIFTHQTEDDFLILNNENGWTPFFLAQNPKSQVFYFSTKPLPKNKHGVFVKKGEILFQHGGEPRVIADVKNFAEKRGGHNLENLLAAALAVTLLEPKLRITKKMIEGLPQIPFRQEIIFQKNGLTIVNDSAGTSPDAVVAAIRRFSTWGFHPQVDFALITGGTDKKLEFAALAKEIKKTISPARLVLLNGSATAKLIVELEKIKFFKKTKPQVFETLDECVKVALAALSKRRGTIVFSPGAASFEKFQNEFDRGEVFNDICVHALNKEV